VADSPAPRVTPELLARYNRPGPRYTSYPTAPQFHTGFGPEEYASRLAAANRGRDPLGLYVHVPFCEKRCLYCGCHVIVTRRRSIVRDYLDHVIVEIGRVADHLPDRRRVSQLHWGGGTPTHLGPAEMRELYGALTDRFEFLPDAEVAIEIDPRVTSPAHLDTLRELGFNRLSLGVQDFTPEVQTAIGREQSFEQTEKLVEDFHSRGFRQFNVDLVYGLPRQTVDAFRSSLAKVVGLRPNRVAVYSYAHVPWIRPHQRHIDESDLPATETKFALFAAAIDAFVEAGYVQIGMDHFALPDDELVLAQSRGALTRNFMGYAVRAAPDLVAFGVSGISDVGGAFAQNEKNLAEYYRTLDDGELPIERGYVLDDDDHVRRFVIQNLMCNFELDTLALSRRFGVEFRDYFATERQVLERTIEPEFYRYDGPRLCVTPLGRSFVRNICMVFDRYLGRHDGERALFSKTV